MDVSMPAYEITCRPFGTCERCPDDSLHEPFCQPFGNRRLMHCTPASTPPPPPPPRPPSHQHEHPPARPPARLQDQGETPAWESCGRIPAVERADFWEFFACNVFFAAVALVVVFARSKRLEAMHARQLAARIGLVRGSGRG
ncbi:hypothetical protein PLICRDRAFT_500101 [Plicaturopsis crispa FD-325 SS-3]|nr:hypothetical protein PLICRDRAFT_500101 [Plicaturopsis crispa FD-325 SS-3]